MKAPTREDRPPKNGTAIGVSPAEVLTAYLEKSPIVQAAIRDLINIVRDGGLPGDERKWAEQALHDALFRHQPSRPENRGRVISVEERQQWASSGKARERMEEEEKRFAANLGRLLEERNLSQAELARRIGVGPSAVSMMLSRECRPQKRTVAKIAEALAVELRELWPG